ncbi:hypothetical protein OQA88_10768 [Cercophora sp. LCS_1]
MDSEKEVYLPPPQPSSQPPPTQQQPPQKQPLTTLPSISEKEVYLAPPLPPPQTPPSPQPPRTETSQSTHSSPWSPTPPTPTPSRAQPVRFHLTIATLALLSFQTTLSLTIVPTALPSIAATLEARHNYVWVAVGYLLAANLSLPIGVQLAAVLGKRDVLLGGVALFMLGSGIAGGARGVGMMVGGRVVQGIGAGVMGGVADLVTFDVVPTRERMSYLGVVYAGSGLAVVLGPVVGGALAQGNWRWVFWLNLPISAVVVAGVLGGLGLKGRETEWNEVDWIGLLIWVVFFWGSVIGLVYGLVTGGTGFAWGDPRIVVSIGVGVLGLAGLCLYRWWVGDFGLPGKMAGDRTSAAVFGLTFLSSVLMSMVGFFLVVYFQGVRGTSALQAGVSLLPMAIGAVLFAGLSRALLSKFGAYRPLHAASFALMAVGFGLFTLLDANSSAAAWVLFQLIAAAGAGMIISVTLPAAVVALSELEFSAVSTAHSFARTFGCVWGVVVPSAIFNSISSRNLDMVILDPDMGANLRSGAAYGFAGLIHGLKDTLVLENRLEIAQVYTDSLKTIWWVGLGLSGLGFVLVGLERGLEPRESVEMEYGLDQKV